MLQATMVATPSAFCAFVQVALGFSAEAGVATSKQSWSQNISVMPLLAEAMTESGRQDTQMLSHKAVVSIIERFCAVV